MLSRAQRQLRDVMSALQHEIDAGVPIVCLEPSCTAVFRDELVNLFPDDAAARKLSSQVHTLAEFLGKLPGYKAPSIQRKALVHAHCHEKALIGNAAQAALCADMGLEARVLDSGCCGVAGSFGYEHYDVSMRIGEHALLPAVRGADKDTLIIADGFSCRSQIEHATDRRAMHLAQVLRMAQDEQPQPVAYPEQRHTQPRLRAPSNIEVALAASLAFVALSGLTRMISPRAGTSAGSPR
jgi:Fe-S oxidoreductase